MKSYKTLCTLAASLLLLGVYAQAQTQDDDTNIVRVVSTTEDDEAVVKGHCNPEPAAPINVLRTLHEGPQDLRVDRG